MIKLKCFSFRYYTLFFLQEHLIRLLIIAKNNFEYHKVLGNCSCVLNFSSSIYMFLLMFLVIIFWSFMLSEMLLISLLKVCFKRNSTKWMLFWKKNFAFCWIIQVLWSKCSLLFFLLIYPRCSVLIFHNFPRLFLFPSSGQKCIIPMFLKYRKKLSFLFF